MNDQIFLITGKIVIYAIIATLTITVAIIALLPFFWMGNKVYRFAKSDFVRYHLGKSYSSEFLRSIYREDRIKKHKPLFKYLLMFRLRNIRMVTKTKER